MNYYDILTIQIFTIIGWEIGGYIYFKLTRYRFISEKGAILTTNDGELNKDGRL